MFPSPHAKTLGDNVHSVIVVFLKHAGINSFPN